jgi:hypothetical protein
MLKKHRKFLAAQPFRKQQAMWDGITLYEPQYAAGDRVQYNPDFTQDRQSGAGLYEIVRSMPIEANGHSYRIKSKTDGHERIAREHQLDKVTY